jgi:uncharacterized protein
MTPTDLPPALEADIITLLSADGDVRCVVTHGARVFVGPTETIKVKRPVSQAYMDFSTRARRHAACRREVEINRTFAADLYLGLVAITREADGRLALDGDGEVLELGVRMRTFPQTAGLDRIADAGPLDATLAVALGDTIARLHQSAPRAAPGLGRTLENIRARLFKSAHERRDALGAGHVDALEAATAALLTRAAPVLDRRRDAGVTRRCHGDLHLGNIVMWRGAPVPFDAIEFDEGLATIDPVYDLAFVLMDLVQRQQQGAATLVLNRYLWRLGADAVQNETWAALVALPLAMALRALVRAVVSVDRERLAAETTLVAPAFEEARRYMSCALTLAAPSAPRLVAVGGMSGSGKSTLAAKLAPGLGAAPGAIHLRSDLERKRLFGIEPETRLAAEGYTAEASAVTYATVLQKAEIALAGGHSVVVDAVFAREGERAAIAAVGLRAGVAFTGLWLDAAPATLAARVAGRRDDASDATVNVLARQLERGAGEVGWGVIPAGGGVDATLVAARARL